jgi:hypothetical protein
MTQPNPGLEKRLHLMKANRSAICVMLCRVARGDRPIADPVVVIADTSDPVGLELAEAAAEQSGLNVQDEAFQVQQRGEIPTAIIVVSLADAKSLFSNSHPSVAGGLEHSPPPGCVRVVSIAAGAAMLVHADVRAVTNIAEA